MADVPSDEMPAPSCRTWSTRPAVHGESRRENQFYQYYGPFKRMSHHDPVFCDVRNPQARKQHKAIPCPDKILTAFCQLGALRMNARRALIFFFDIKHAYVMAEATRTLSLEDHSIHDPGDHLWMGHAVIPRDVACCEVTINLPSFPAVARVKGELHDSVFVVNDLTNHPEFHDRPYVTDHPNGRFYAGVPITTPSGINIGAYCILDDKPRDTVSQQDLVFLRDMSQTVMKHLETTRALSDRQQNNDMVAGLSRFMRGQSDFKVDPMSATNMSLGDSSVSGSLQSRFHRGVPDALVDPIASPVLVTSHLARTEYFDTETTSAQQGHEDNSAILAALSPDQEATFKTNRPTTLSHTPAKDDQKTPRGIPAALEQNRIRRPPLAKRSKSRARNAHQRAAETLCQSLRLDGVAFLDASVSTFGGLAETTETSTGGESDEPESMPSDAEPQEGRTDTTKTCKVLGCAQAIRAEAMIDPPRPAMKLTESVIRKLMRHHPSGAVWTFDEDLNIHSEDDASGDNEPADISKPVNLGSTATQRKKSAREERCSDGQRLQLAFPGARCVALHSIWDYTRRRWSVAAVLWTYDPLRVLCLDTEMRFVSTFCDVIVAETRRLEVVDSDKAKSDFMSSVSHELRSPLHGILGSVEILAEHALDSTASVMVEQIDSCGRSLLDIIDHLLDFADLKKQRLRKGAVKSSRIGKVLSPSSPSLSYDRLSALEKDVALDALTEEVVVSSVYSYHYNREIERRNQTLVILDIHRSVDVSWRCQLATGGWKRICMNLVTNALKYTPAGFVRVSLKQVLRPGPRRRFDAILCVADSGKGMSAEFQRDHLFRDFSQEDTMSSGLGIGLHMVSRIVAAMGGKIELVSNQNGAGTQVTLTVPLEHQPDRGESTVDDSALAYKVMFGLKASVLMKDRQPPVMREDGLVATAWALATTSIRNDLKSLGFQLEDYSYEHSFPCDLTVVMEDDLDQCLQSVRNAQRLKGNEVFPPMLVVCRNDSTAHKYRDSRAENSLSVNLAMQYIALPCGIKQMARAINSVLESHREIMASAEVTLQPSDGSQSARISENGHFTQDSESPQAIAPHSPISQRAIHEQPGAVAHQPRPKDMQQSIKQNLPLIVPLPPSPPGDEVSHSKALPRHGTSPEPSNSVPMTLPAPKRPTLLLVDDNNINLQLLTMFAKKRKYPYLTAVDGSLALDAFVNAHRASLSSQEVSLTSESGAGMPSIILMDINMPIMDGYEAVQHIRAYERRHSLVPAKIMAVTALESEAAHNEAYGSGFNWFLSKPIKLQDLTRIIEEQSGVE